MASISVGWSSSCRKYDIAISLLFDGPRYILFYTHSIYRLSSATTCRLTTIGAPAFKKTQSGQPIEIPIPYLIHR